MEDIKNIFIKKKILIYGLGKSGLSSYYFLKKNNNLYLYDDDRKAIKDKKIKKIFIKPENIFKNNFDFIFCYSFFQKDGISNISGKSSIEFLIF